MLELEGENATVGVFRLPPLVIGGIGTEMSLGGLEFLMKVGIEHRAEDVQIAEVVVPAFQIPGAVG